MMPQYQVLKGMRDLLPEEVGAWQEVEARARHFFEAQGFEEIRTPILESTDLFARSIGEGSDIVSKQMYSFNDRGGRGVTLRPEMTASVVRACIENGILRSSKTARLYYLGPMFRAERPQRGRQRQFHQLGAEILNAKLVASDIEILALAHGVLKFLGAADVRLLHNYLGSEEERGAYAGELRKYFLKLKDQMCEDCKFRLEKNVLRILDCKVPSCQPHIRSSPVLKLSADSEKTYADIRKGLDARKVESQSESRLVRGLDYYTGLVFEIVAGGELGSQDAVAAGGRYDGLIASLGGPPLGATGFAAGLERLILALRRRDLGNQRMIYVATMDSGAGVEACFQNVVKELYQIGRRVKRDPNLKSLSDHLRQANKMGIRYVVILGEDEVKSHSLTIKDLEAKSQERVAVGQLTAYLAAKKEALC